MKFELPNAAAHAEAQAPLSSDWGGQARLGWLVLLGGFGVFLIWSILAPLDKGVPVIGTVVVSGQRQTVQSPLAGVVETILVREGQAVSAGQVLATMQPQSVEAVAGASLATYSLAQLTRERLLAELDGRPSMGLPSGLARYTSEASIQSQLANQQQLLRDRLRTHAAEMAALTESLHGLQQQRTALMDSGRSKLRESQLLEDQSGRLRALVDKGFASVAALDEVELKKARVQGEIAENQGALRRIEAQLDEIRLTRDRRVSERQQEIKAKLAEVQRDIEGAKGQLGSAELNRSYAEIKAPVAGYVLGLAVTNPGAVLAPGARLLDIVPMQGKLVVEAQVPVNLIDQVRGGLSVDLMFSAFQQNKTPRLTGSVTTVGADRMVDQRTGAPYYPVSVEIDAMSVIKLGSNEVRPGMPVDVFIKTGERTFLSYLLKPLTDRMGQAFTQD
jgi:protease secretion system membrane fusion protein